MMGKMDTEQELICEYEGMTKKKFIYITAASGLLLVLILYATAAGSLNISFSRVLAALAGRGEGNTPLIVWNIRLPRVLAAVLAGGGLAVSGAVMQSILKNPLGSPFTLGVSQAAGFGAAFAIVVLGAGSIEGGDTVSLLLDNPYIITISAFFWAMVSTGIILLLIKYKGASPETMILTGVALGSLFTAGTTALQYLADEVELSSIVFWTFGDVGRATWMNILLIFVILIPVLVYFIYKSWDYTMLSSGDESARSLGVSVEKVRIAGMLLSSLLTAIIISFVGIIGFVGLVAPHIGRKLIGPQERYLLPFSVLIGCILLLAADTLARTAFSPLVLPVGILTSFLGAPMFIYLVIRGGEYMWT